MAKQIAFIDEPKHMVSESPLGRVYVYWDEYRSNRFLHIRLWYLDKLDGTYKPSKKGIAIPEYKVQGLVTALTAALKNE